MYQAKVYTVSIPNSGVALEEEHIAMEVIARWNIEEGEKRGVAFLAIPNNYKGIIPDIYIFAIENYMDKQKVEDAIKTGAKVVLFLCSHHDEKSTIASEVEMIDDFHHSIQDKCICLDYNNLTHFEKELLAVLSKLNR